LRNPRNLWERHPAVRTGAELTLGERAADTMRNGMGSWRFIFLFLIFMGTWAGINIYWLSNKGFDPYPFILLNLLLSTMAGLQAAALLIAAKRQDSISSEVAVHTATNTEDIKQLLTENTDLTKTVKDLTEEVKVLAEELRTFAQTGKLVSKLEK
jgi:uncharacterized membrane protein